MRERVALYAVAVTVCAVVLAPLAAPGYVLAFDMVFVPRQPLRWDLVAPADALPRAVPLDAAVSLVSLLVPGWLTQRFALVAVLALAAVGAGRLVPADRLITRVVAAVGYAWTPYLAERLLLGQWALLLAYATLPWLVAAVLGVRAGRAGALARVVLAAAPAALTPTGGLVALAATVALVPPRRRTGWLAVGAVVVLNAPWLVATAVTSAGGRSDPAGVAAFAARAENWSGALGALAGTGGIWNARTTPDSRSSVLVPVVTVALLVLAWVGVASLRERWGDAVALRLAVLAGGAFVLSAAAVLPGGAAALEWAVVNLPGAGLLRDGQKFLIPYALALVICAALGAERLAARLPTPAAARVVAVGVLLLPVVALPDLAFGGAGRLRPVSYPPDWDVVADRIAERPGPVLSLPMSFYRAYPWNPRSVVIDPLPRYVPAEVLVDDTLLVGTSAVAGENPRMAELRRLIAAGAPVSGSGVRWVVVQRDAGQPVGTGTLAGLQLVHSGPSLTLYENPSADSVQPAAAWRRWLAALVGFVALGLVVGSAVRLAVSGRRNRAADEGATDGPATDGADTDDEGVEPVAG